MNVDVSVHMTGMTNIQARGMRAARGREAALAAQWSAGTWCGQTLRAEDGECYQLLFQGRPGGGAGPDFRDAVLLRGDGTRVRGDVELHLHARNWHAHGHSADPRYNGVVLHAVLATSASQSPQANGALVPIVVLRPPSAPASLPASWPCESWAIRVGSAGVRTLLLAAGRARFDAKAEAFARELVAGGSDGDEAAPVGWKQADRALFVALAEALGYGRDREALREAGFRLARGEPPETLLERANGGYGDETDCGHGRHEEYEQQWPRIERLRLRGLLALYGRWHAHGPWRELREALLAGNPREVGRRLVARLLVDGGCVSPGRARIVVANVVLPFAAAVGSVTGDAALVLRAAAVYDALTGLPSNQITREMRRQLGLPRLPSGAAPQQGLHHVWASWCRDKHCAACPCGASDGASIVNRRIREGHEVETD